MEPDVHPMDGLTTRLAALDTCAVSDALDKLGRFVTALVHPETAPANVVALRALA